MAETAGQRDHEAVGHIPSSIRKQNEMNDVAQLAFSFFV